MEIAAASDILPFLRLIAVITVAGGMVLSLPGMGTVALLTDMVCTEPGSRSRGAEAWRIDDKRLEVFARQYPQVILTQGHPPDDAQWLSDMLSAGRVTG